MSRSQTNHQLNLPPTKVEDVENGGGILNKVENDENNRKAAALRTVGELIELARVKSGLTRKEACALMFIKEQQYSRWVDGASSNDTPSIARLWLLPPAFWLHMNSLINERKGLRRLIAADLLRATADAALALQA